MGTVSGRGGNWIKPAGPSGQRTRTRRNLRLVIGRAIAAFKKGDKAALSGLRRRNPDLRGDLTDPVLAYLVERAGG